MREAGRQPNRQPLLTIAIPTYNRAAYLMELLESLLPQLAAVAAEGRSGDVELIISDNAATDNTATVIAWAQEYSQKQGIHLCSVRRAENIGPDRNFLACFREATGCYFWVLGDDDIVRPGGIAGILDGLRGGTYDIVFLAPHAFYSDWQKEFSPDPWGREGQVIQSGRHMARIVNVGITFISGYIVNRDRALQVLTDPPEAFIGTNLVQLSWALPLLRNHRQSLVLWQRFVCGRALNSGGYNVAEVFGERFLEVVRRLLPDKPGVAAIFPNFALRRWFPASIQELRRRAFDRQTAGVNADGAEATLRRLFGRNFRYWLFTWPVLRLPVEAAEQYLRVSEKVNKMVDLALLPSDTFGKLMLRTRRGVLKPGGPPSPNDLTGSQN